MKNLIQKYIKTYFFLNRVIIKSQEYNGWDKTI